MAAAVFTCGKKALITPWVTGFSRRDGIVTNRVVPPTSIVLLAISFGVSCESIFAGTTGLTELFSLEKSPVQSSGCGKVVLRTVTGEFCNLRSYARKK